MTKLIRMVGTFLFTLTFCIFTLQAQELSLQELVNRKQFPEVLTRVDSFCELCDHVGYRPGV